MDKRNSKESMLTEIARLKKACNSAKNNNSAKKLMRVYEAGVDGICHVARANYQSREDEANRKLNRAMWGTDE